MKAFYKFIFILIVLFVLAGSGVYWYVFMRSPQNIEHTKADYKISSSELYKEYSTDETNANTKYLGKIIEVTGLVVQVNVNEKQTVFELDDIFFGVTIYLSNSFCQNNEELVRSIRPDQSVTIRGKCDGFLNDVVISRAVIVQ